MLAAYMKNQQDKYKKMQERRQYTDAIIFVVVIVVVIAATIATYGMVTQPLVEGLVNAGYLAQGGWGAFFTAGGINSVIGYGLTQAGTELGGKLSVAMNGGSEYGHGRQIGAAASSAGGIVAGFKDLYQYFDAPTVETVTKSSVKVEGAICIDKCLSGTGAFTTILFKNLSTTILKTTYGLAYDQTLGYGGSNTGVYRSPRSKTDNNPYYTYSHRRDIENYIDYYNYHHD
jgi:hypothetical protein